MTPTNEHRSLALIADDLAAYQETLAMIDWKIADAGPGAPVDELLQEQQAIKASLASLALELCRKVDRLPGVLARLESEEKVAAQEEARQAARRRAAKESREWLKGYIVDVIEARGGEPLVGQTCRLVARGNGGIEPLEISQPTHVPFRLQQATGTLKAPAWTWIAANMPTELKPYLSLKMEPDPAAIRRELQTPCAFCQGLERADPCPSCNGTGLSGVPGARLLPRGKHLRVL